jgi:hypothetical protein
MTPRRACPSVCVTRNANGGEGIDGRSVQLDTPIAARRARTRAPRRAFRACDQAITGRATESMCEADAVLKKFLTKDRVLCLTSKSSHP